MHQDHHQRSSLSPAWRYLAVLLATTIVVELSTMLLLPLVVTIDHEGWTAVAVDLTGLVLIQAPLFWWVVVRPLRVELHAAGERYRLLFERSLAGVYACRLMAGF